MPLDSTFVKQIQDGLNRPSEILDTGYSKKVLVVHNPLGEAKVEIFDSPREYEPTTLPLSTLAGIVSYVKANLAGIPVIVQVGSPTMVNVLALVVGECRQQLHFAMAKPTLPSIHYGNFLSLETFLIQLASCFVSTEERKELQKFCGSVRSAKATEIEDDGVTQNLTVQSGITRMNTATMKPEWELAPFRTFPEVEQPASSFVVRMKQDEKQPVMAAIFEADGGAWRPKAITAIGNYLREQLGESAIILA